MFRILVLLSLVAFSVAKTPLTHCCSAEDRQIVQRQWKNLWTHTESSKLKIGFGKRILLKLAELKPEVKELFHRVNIEHPDSGEFSAHCMRILNALDMCINLMDHPAALKEAVDHLAHQHHEHPGIKKEHFKIFGQLLIGHGLPRVLDEYDGMAWKACFKGFLFQVAANVPA